MTIYRVEIGRGCARMIFPVCYATLAQAMKAHPGPWREEQALAGHVGVWTNQDPAQPMRIVEHTLHQEVA